MLVTASDINSSERQNLTKDDISERQNLTKDDIDDLLSNLTEEDHYSIEAISEKYRNRTLELLAEDPENKLLRERLVVLFREVPVVSDSDSYSDSDSDSDTETNTE
jgi:hypothetical protein